MAGRPTLLTPTVIKAMSEGIRKGNYASTVMKGLGMHPANHWKWYKKGENGELDSKGSDIYIRYYHAINEAEAEAEERMINQWQQFFPSDWRAIQTFMERRWGDRWGRNDKVRQELTGKDGGAIETDQKHKVTKDLSELTDEELMQLESILGKPSDSGGDTTGES